MTKWNTLLTIFHLSWSILWGWILGSRDSEWEWKHLWWSLSSSLGDTHRQSSWVWFTSFLIWSTLDSWTLLAGNCVSFKHLWWQLPDSPDATHRPSSSPPAGPAPNDTNDQTAPSHLRRISLTRGFVICYLQISKWGRSNMKYLLKENGWKNLLGGRSSIFWSFTLDTWSLPTKMGLAANIWPKKRSSKTSEWPHTCWALQLFALPVIIHHSHMPRPRPYPPR